MTDATPTNTSKVMGAGTRNRIIEYTQAGIAASIIGAMLGLYIVRGTSPTELVALASGIVGFYFGKRGDYSVGNGSKSE